ncbi:MAG: 6-carboxytetrahydropterin synthase [Candidatus Omnitrophica bacterium]|nr:6-carboxytetrahydropterin synthase [Candidatus Omnitrophota bacterium]MBU4149785.1 6-carboxytetrahydropterin synthase [Candidatus Omnitrophota bacterium]
MYEILIRSDFCGAHNLRGYRGRCEELHGHNWKIEARFEKERVDNIGIAADFKILKIRLKTILAKLDHAYLNKLKAFKARNPSAENIAKYIYDKLVSSIKFKGLSVKSVSVWESDNSCATYYE